ncbi:PREDICTED: calmodulin-regulated spectrin-associated protein 2-like [Priapulus caudatus]|uniref:Calmodulin-regulated spectrin-associated protein 2-like n=1 Tax=Priapulus caudatus TaxID=37621 RepID=A0ABM1EYE7_PRICU|nr:PREDICTED: calmodulin-regulated spectrin-associated protein 2-like [Priapulus caudatus]
MLAAERETAPVTTAAADGGAPCGDVAEIPSADDYDVGAAKERAAILWLLGKAYDGKIPGELGATPHYRDDGGQRHLRPAVVNALATGDAYARAAAAVFGNPEFENQRFSFLLQFLSRRGERVCVADGDNGGGGGGEVTEAQLVQTSPLRVAAHVATVDALIAVHAREVATPTRVAHAVAHLGGAPCGDSDGGEAGLAAWVNAAWGAFATRRAVAGRPVAALPTARSPLAPALADGRRLAALLSVYCPDDVSPDDVVTTTTSIADSLRNVEIARRFCARWLPAGAPWLRAEDVVYAAPALRRNALAMVAEIFDATVVRPREAGRGADGGHLPQDPGSQQNGLSAAPVAHDDWEDEERGPATGRSLVGQSFNASHSAAAPRSAAEARAAGIPESHGVRDRDKRRLARQNLKDEYLSNEEIEHNHHHEKDWYHTDDVQQGRGCMILLMSSVPICMVLSEGNDKGEPFHQQDALLQHSTAGCQARLRLVHPSADPPNMLPSLLIGWTLTKIDQIHGPVIKGKATDSKDVSTTIKEEKETEATSPLDRSATFRVSREKLNEGGTTKEKEEKEEPAATKSSHKLADINSATFRVEKTKTRLALEETKPKPAPPSSPPPASTKPPSSAAATSSVIAPGEENKRKQAMTRREIEEKLDVLRQKWLSESLGSDTAASDDNDAVAVAKMDEEQLHASVRRYESQMHELQAEIARLTVAEEQAAAMTDSQTSVGSSHSLPDAAAPAPPPPVMYHHSGMQQYPPVMHHAPPPPPPQPPHVSPYQQYTYSPQYGTLPPPPPHHPQQQQQQQTYPGMPPYPGYHDQYQPYYPPAPGGYVYRGGSGYPPQPPPHPHPQQQHPAHRYGYQPYPATYGSQEHLQHLSLSQENLRGSPDRYYRGGGGGEWGGEQQQQQQQQQQQLLRAHSDQDMERSPRVDPPAPHQEAPPSPLRERNVEEEMTASPELPQPPVAAAMPTSPLYTSASEPIVSYSDRQVAPESPPLPTLAPSPSFKENINAGFVISFDDDTPRKKKPPLSRVKKKPTSGKKNGGGGVEGSETSSGTATPDLVAAETQGDIDAPPPPPQFISPMTVAKTETTRPSPGSGGTPARHSHPPHKHASSPRSPDAATEGSRIEVASPGVAFVLGEEGEEGEVGGEGGGGKVSDEEMMKRKQRIMLSALKRKEKQEQRRTKIEQENARRREKLREKQEETDRKKEEERVRRQLIWDDYVRRKEEARLAEDGLGPGGEPPASSSSTSSSAASKPKPKPARPKSMVQEKAAATTTERQSSPMRPKSMYHHQEEAVEDEGEVGGRGGGGGGPPRRNGRPSPAFERNSDQMSDVSSGGDRSGGDPYSGPKLFVKPSGKSNRTIVTNAISHRCLAGTVNADTKRRVLDTLARSDRTHFLVLFRDAGCQFRSLYAHDGERDRVTKLYGSGPRVITHAMMSRFYKYESGAKQFVEIHSKHLSATIDALTIDDRFWQQNKKASGGVASAASSAPSSASSHIRRH